MRGDAVRFANDSESGVKRNIGIYYPSMPVVSKWCIDRVHIVPESMREVIASVLVL